MSEIHCYTSTRKVKKYVIAYENIHSICNTYSNTCVKSQF